MRSLRLSLLIVVIVVTADIVCGQISPPGLSDTHAAAWGAVGFVQPLGKRWTTTVYLGASRESNPDNYDPAVKSAIAVVNQETQYAFNSRWQLSWCSSFRVQNRYAHEEPFNAADPAFRDEVRLYTRLYHRLNVRRWNFTFSFRPELRLFYETDFSVWYAMPEQVRFRLKAQVARALDEKNRNQVIVANEWLSVTDEIHRSSGQLAWTPLEFSEDRLTTYFRHTFQKPALIFDIGVMHQFSFAGSKSYIAHLAFDVLFQNPFGKKKKVSK